jgi:formamidopyrimidine-DNA glycosylase
MPEAPEVETIKRDIEPFLVGRRIQDVWVSGKALRIPAKPTELNRLRELTVQSLHRHGKLLWIQLTSKAGLFFRLGMTGRLHINDSKEPKVKHTHVCLMLDNGTELRFVDPRRFGCVVPFFDEKEKQFELNKMSHDPLSWDETAINEIARKLCRSDRLLKVLLMDQKIVAGVGNIYASEALFLSKLSPSKKGTEVTMDQVKDLLVSCRRVMEIAVEQRGTTFMSYVDGFGRKGDNLSRLKVFSRTGKPCKVCETTIEKIVQAGRSTFYCPYCQK